MFMELELGAEFELVVAPGSRLAEPGFLSRSMAAMWPGGCI